MTREEEHELHEAWFAQCAAYCAAASISYVSALKFGYPHSADRELLKLIEVTERWDAIRCALTGFAPRLGRVA